MIDPNYSSNKTIWAGSVSGGLWKTTNIDSIDYNYDFEYNSLSFSMTPNPVSSSGTKIFFYLEEKQHVILNIYDIRGKLISQILNEELEKGEYSHQWVPETDLRHGIYLIIIKAGKEKDTKKFTYINLY